MIEDVIIQDKCLLDGFNEKIIFYGIVRHLATISCFGMYSLMSLCLDQLNRYAGNNLVTIAGEEGLKQPYTALKKTFDRSFAASAINLSVFVLWIGLTINAINQTEALRSYSMYAGKAYLSNDLPYLVGAMHLLILLLFYIPVKLRFNSLEITEEAKGQACNNGNNSGFLKGISEKTC